MNIEICLYHLASAIYTGNACLMFLIQVFLIDSIYRLRVKHFSWSEVWFWTFLKLTLNSSTWFLYLLFVRLFNGLTGEKLSSSCYCRCWVVTCALVPPRPHPPQLIWFLHSLCIVRKSWSRHIYTMFQIDFVLFFWFFVSAVGILTNQYMDPPVTCVFMHLHMEYSLCWSYCTTAL